MRSTLSVPLPSLLVNILRLYLSIFWKTWSWNLPLEHDKHKLDVIHSIQRSTGFSNRDTSARYLAYCVSNATQRYRHCIASCTCTHRYAQLPLMWLVNKSESHDPREPSLNTGLFRVFIIKLCLCLLLLLQERWNTISEARGQVLLSATKRTPRKLGQFARLSRLWR